MRWRWIVLSGAVALVCAVLWPAQHRRGSTESPADTSRILAPGVLKGEGHTDSVAPRPGPSRPQVRNPSASRVAYAGRNDTTSLIPSEPGGTIEVEVVFTAGTPPSVKRDWLARGSARLFNPGQANVPGYQGQASISQGFARLAAPRAGRYDVVVNCGPTQLIARDVDTGPRGTTHVAVHIPKPVPSRVTWDQPLPDRRIRIDFALRHATTERVRYAMTRVGEAPVDAYVPIGTLADVSVRLEIPSGHSAPDELEHAIRWSPAQVRAGGSLRVWTQPRSKLTVRISRPELLFRVDVTQRDVGSQLGGGQHVEIFDDMNVAEFLADDGPATIRWSGEAHGSRTVTIRGDTVIDIDPVPSDRPTVAFVAQLPDTVEPPFKSPFCMECGTKPPRADMHRTTWKEGGATVVVWGEYTTRGTTAFARWGDFVGTISTPEPGGTVDVPLSRGGYLGVSRIRPIPPLSEVRIRRLDRQRVWVTDRTFEFISTMNEVVLGPIRPGTHTFEVWIGAVKMGEVQALVVAGETRPLNIRSR